MFKWIKKHIAYLKHEGFKKLALDEHSHKTSHQICIEKTLILSKEEHLTKRKVREKIEIELNQGRLNKYDGSKLSETWKPLLCDLQKSCNRSDDMRITG